MQQNPMDQPIMVHGICSKCGHMCEQPLTQRGIDRGDPIICCGGTDAEEPTCGNKITNYEKVQ